jgi:hypothetical protein
MRGRFVGRFLSRLGPRLLPERLRVLWDSATPFLRPGSLIPQDAGPEGSS